MAEENLFDYHYYLRLPKEDVDKVHAGLSNLYGYIMGKMEQNVDSKHGPINQEGSWADELTSAIIPLKNALDKDKHKIIDLNKQAQAARKQFVDDVILAIKESKSGDTLDLIKRLMAAINNYEIIGVNQNYNGKDFDEDLPF